MPRDGQIEPEAKEEVIENGSLGGREEEVREDNPGRKQVKRGRDRDAVGIPLRPPERKHKV